jgi:hypothetical protein
MSPDTIWTLVAFALTILILSYIFGDHFLFRLATYTFVGVATGYAVVLVIYQVLLPRLIWPLMQGSLEERAWLLVPLILSVLLLSKLIPSISRLGSLSMAYLVGIGAAVTIGGAVLGTLITQARASLTAIELSAQSGQSTDPFMQILDGIVLLLGTISTLAYFHFSARSDPGQPPRRPIWVEGLAGTGKVFIAITLGSLFAGVYVAAITALIQRLDFLIFVFYRVIRPMIF